MIILIIFLLILGCYLTLYVSYMVFLLFTRYLVRVPNKAISGDFKNFLILVPAHNEELFLPRLLESVNLQDFPRKNFKTVVVADNCNDKTAKIARNLKATVLERFDRTKLGKGYAIQYGLSNIELERYDAVVIVDADCVFDRKVLQSFDQILREGKKVMQSYSGLANPEESWFTRLICVSQAVSNEIILLAKSKLGFSIPLMGTGMCFAKEVLLKFGWDAFSVGEDWEYYAKLIKEGETIVFAKDAYVYHQESSTLKQATSQRMRWSSGRFAIAWKYGFSLLYSGLKEGNLSKIDASFPLLLPNPSLGINITMLGCIASLLVLITTHSFVYFFWFALLVIGQLILFIFGIFYTRNKFKNFLSLFIAPLFLSWKLLIDILSVLGMGRQKWIRTERKG